MKVDRKHFGLIVASFIALSFNSQFAQAARRTQELLRPARVFAYRRARGSEVYLPARPEESRALAIKKTGVRIDRRNVYIGGYVVNSSDRVIPHARIFPTFVRLPRNAPRLAERLHHDLLNLQPRETRRFVIKRSIADVRPLLEQNIPIAANCILHVKEL